MSCIDATPGRKSAANQWRTGAIDAPDRFDRHRSFRARAKFYFLGPFFFSCSAKISMKFWGGVGVSKAAPVSDFGDRLVGVPLFRPL